MYKKIMKLAIPIIFANILLTIYQFIDLFWIGRYNDTGIASIGLSSNVIFLFVSILMGLTIAGTVLASQSKGRENYEELNKIVGQSIIIGIIFGLIVGIIGYFSSDFIIGLMDAEEVVKQEAIGYLKISFMGVVPIGGYMIIQALLRGLGEVKKPVYILLFTIFLNFIIDPLFIMGYGPFPELGVKGAALSTIFTQTIAWIIAFIIIYKKGKYNLYLNKKYFKIHPEFFKKFLAIGIPSSLEMSARSLGGVILTYIVATFSTVIISSYTLGNQILGIVIYMAAGLSMATMTLAGQFYGAGKTNELIELRKKASVLSFFSLTIAGIIVFIFAPYLVEIFAPGKEEIIKSGTEFLRIMSLFIGFIGLQQIITGLFRGIGEAKIPMILTMSSVWLMEIPISYFGSHYFAEKAIWWSIPISNILIAIISYVWYSIWIKKIKA